MTLGATLTRIKVDGILMLKKMTNTELMAIVIADAPELANATKTIELRSTYLTEGKPTVNFYLNYSSEVVELLVKTYGEKPTITDWNTLTLYAEDTHFFANFLFI